MKRRVFYCDGSSRPIEGGIRCGWAVSMQTHSGAHFVMSDEVIAEKGSDRRELSSAAKTNNVGELTAFLMTLRCVEDWCKKGETVVIRPDSQYVIKGLITEHTGTMVSSDGRTTFPSGWMRGWLKNDWTNSKNEPVKNKELWLELLKVGRRLSGRITVEIEWVKGKTCEEALIVDRYAKGLQ